MSEQAGDPVPWWPTYVYPYYGHYQVTNNWSYQVPDTLKVKKLHPEAQLPSKSREADEGYDLYSLEDIDLAPGETAKVKTGIALGLPKDYWAKIEGRSGLASQGITVFGGVIDNEYVGEIIVCLHNSNHWAGKRIGKGNKIAQFVLHKHRHLSIIEVTELDTTNRGEAGFGSSGQ